MKRNKKRVCLAEQLSSKSCVLYRANANVPQLRNGSLPAKKKWDKGAELVATSIN